MALKKFIVSGSDDKTVKIWNYKTSECISTLKGHNNSITSVTIIPDSLQIVSGSSDKKIKLWDYEESSTRIFIPFDH